MELLADNLFAALEQAHSGEPAEHDVERQAEAGPPYRHSGVFNAPVVDEVEKAMARHDCNYQPEASLKSDNGEQGESARHQNLRRDCAAGRSHGGEQNVIRGGHHEDCRVESAIAV